MTKTRSYKLLCPIAQALDRVGDRWTLLILRDLFAGPARFGELQTGLTGIAANLLTDRLSKLTADGFIEKTAEGAGPQLYRLTALGQKTGDLIFDLAQLGAHFKPEGEIVPPGNLRTVATTLGLAAQRVEVPHTKLRAAFIVDGEEMALTIEHGKASMLYARCKNPDVTFKTSYKAMMALSEGELSPEEFQSKQSTLEVHTKGREDTFLSFMMRLFSALDGPAREGE